MASVSGAEYLYLYHWCAQAAASALGAAVDGIPPADFCPCPARGLDYYDGSWAAAEIANVCAGDRSDDCGMPPLPALDAPLKKLASYPVRSPYGASSRQNSFVPPVWMSRVGEITMGCRCWRLGVRWALVMVVVSCCGLKGAEVLGLGAMKFGRPAASSPLLDFELK